MSTFNVSPFDFMSAAATEFAGRPTLRSVVSEQLLATLVKQFPDLEAVTPPLTSADPLLLISPVEGEHFSTTRPLVDLVLDAMAQGDALLMEPAQEQAYSLKLSAEYRFKGADSEFDVKAVTGASEPLNALLAELGQAFAQAQRDYWRADGAAGASRDRWLQLLLKQALLQNLPLQGLDEQEQACVHGLLRGESTPSTFLVHAQLGYGDESFSITHPNLLLTGEWDERLVVLWYSPSSRVRSFESLDAFALALRDELALEYRFETMTWDRYLLEGDVFAQLAALLLNDMQQRIGQVRYSQVDDAAQLEALFAALSNPAQWFYADYFIDAQVVANPPPGIAAANASNRFAYQDALFNLALDQIDADGVGALADILDLHSYTRERLAERMNELHPDEENPSADDVQLALAVAAGEAGGAGAGTGGGEPLVPSPGMTLTEFAIGNLAGLVGHVITGISLESGGEVPVWMDADALKTLVSYVDVGERYPRYVATLLDDRATRDARVVRFAREWRSALLFAGLSARIDGKLSDEGLQCLTDFCRPHANGESLDMTLFPLAFKRRPDTDVHDQVAGMYVLYRAVPATVLLYRPLYRSRTLREFASLDLLMAAIRDETELQQEILQWIAPEVQSIYDNGGFAEPHISSIGIDPFDLPERPAPAGLGVVLWRTNVDEKLYQANRDLLVALADLQSTSNAESRWALLSGGAWLLYNTVSLFLSGPVASVDWLMQSVESLESDLEAISSAGEFDRSKVAVDVVLSLGMALSHVKSAAIEQIEVSPLPQNRQFEGPPLRGQATQVISAVPLQGKVGEAGSVGQVQGLWHDLSWRGQQGFNIFPPALRQALRALRVGVDLKSVEPLTEGEAAHTYEVDGLHYVSLASDNYQVSITGEGVRVVGAQGEQGPMLSRVLGAWRVDDGLNLPGGGRTPTSVNLERNFKKMRQAADRDTEHANVAAEKFSKVGQEVRALSDELEAAHTLMVNAQAEAEVDEVLVQQYASRIAELKEQIHTKRLEAVTEMETVIQIYSKASALLGQMLEPKYGASLRLMGEAIPIQARAEMHNAMINGNDFVLGELEELVDYPKLNEQVKAIQGVIPRKSKEQYRLFRLELEKAVALQERMLVCTSNLDQLLAQSEPELQIVAGASTRSVAQIVAKRLFTTEDLRFHHVLDLVTLSLHHDSPTGLSKLAHYEEALRGASLRSTANAHGDSIMANLSHTDRVIILQEAWDEYAAAIINSDFVARDGGALVDPAMLKRYKEHLQLLKDDAGRRLVEARNALDGKPVSTTVGSAYVTSGEVQHAIRNRDGMLIIATEVQEDGVDLLVVRDPLRQAVVQRFDRVDGQWVERTGGVAAPVAAEEPAEDRAREVLADNARVLELAPRYVAQDISGRRLARLFDQQITRLQAAEGELPEQSDVGESLVAGRTALQDKKIERLTQLYLATPYPDAEALRFMHARELIRAEYVARKTMVDGSAFDEYRIISLSAPGKTKGRNLWVAHFHLPSQDAAARDFTRGHLKLWQQRFETNRAPAATSDLAPGRRVHYGPLTLAEAEGIIPF